jgi:hypothetical protein
MTNNPRRRAFAILLSLEIFASALSAHADEWRFRGHDIRRFRDLDLDAWRHGHWYHGWHEGRFGWWWVRGGLWYFYPVPVYPYSDPYIPPPGVAILPPPAAAPPPYYWYYCSDPPGYYPYVPACRVHWWPVPPTP